MDYYLKEHFVVKFFLFLLLGFGILIFSYRIFKSYKKEDLEPIKENTYSRMIYWRSIGGMLLGVFIIAISLYMLFEDLTKPIQDNSNRFEKVYVK